jgi:hypothetical protein
VGANAGSFRLAENGTSGPAIAPAVTSDTYAATKAGIITALRRDTTVTSGPCAACPLTRGIYPPCLSLWAERIRRNHRYLFVRDANMCMTRSQARRQKDQEDGHFYTLERVRGFDVLCPRTVGKEARIRLLLNAATKFDPWRLGLRHLGAARTGRPDIMVSPFINGGCSPPQFERSVQRLQRYGNQGIGSWKRRVRALAFLGDGLPPGNGRRVAQLKGTVRPRPVSMAAGSQRHERAGWDGPAPLLPLLAAGGNALAPYGRGKGRDTPRHRTALIPAAGYSG